MLDGPFQRGFMKFFLTISLLSALILSLQGPGVQAAPESLATQKAWLASLPIKGALIETFEHSQNGQVFWAFLTGDKKQISPKLKTTFNTMELGFLFSPSGIHLAAVFLLLFILLKLFFPKKISTRLKFFVYLLFYFFPSFAIKRIILLRSALFLKHRLKRKWSLEILFFVVFLLSFLLGHYFQSPLGFVMSFLFMGTFIGLRHYSRWTILTGLFASHLLLALFSGKEISPLALLLNLPILFYFSGMMSLSGLFLASFKWIPYNWMEKFISLLLLMIKKSALISRGTHLNSSLFFILGLWMILFKRDKKWMALCFLLHANLANSPSCFVSGSLTRSPLASADKSLYYSGD